MKHSVTLVTGGGRSGKSRHALQLAMVAKMDLGLIHFNPNNIAKRMAFEYIESEEVKEADKDIPDEEA